MLNACVEHILIADVVIREMTSPQVRDVIDLHFIVAFFL